MNGKTPATRTRVGKYELGKTLGEGTFAKVKFAKNVENGDYVAIKILDREKVLRHRMVEQVWWSSLFFGFVMLFVDYPDPRFHCLLMMMMMLADQKRDFDSESDQASECL